MAIWVLGLAMVAVLMATIAFKVRLAGIGTDREETPRFSLRTQLVQGRWVTTLRPL